MQLSALLCAAKGRGDMLGHMRRTAREAHAICGRPTAALFFDIASCAAKYGAGPTDYMMLRFYECSAAERATYLTRLRSAAFVKRVNDRADAPVFNDKNTFSEKFRDLMGRETFDLRTGSFQDFCRFAQGKDALMAKPVDADCGRGIEKLWTRDFADAKALWDYLKDPQKPFGIAEEVLVQHPDMAALHPQSVNCVRIATFVKDDGTPTVIYAACKAGSGDAACDNTGRGGITCRLDIDSGTIISNGHSEELEEYTAHPDTGITLRGFRIPLAAECRALALKAALRYPRFRYVGWDICITPTGPVLIEGNDYPGYDLAQMPDRDAPHPREGLIPRFTEQGIEI